MKAKPSESSPGARALTPARWVALASLSFTLCLTCDAALILSPGTVSLQPNQANQTVPFSINNTGSAQSVTGLEFWVQIGDGFHEVPGSSDNGPNLMAVNLVTGTAFAGNNGGQTDFLFSQLANSVVATSSGTVTLQPGPNALATLTFDTTGFFGGTWDLKFDDVFSVSGFKATRFGALDNGTVVPVGLQIGDGQLAVIPEPSAIITACVLVLAAAGHALRRWQRRRAESPGS